ncbi:unnamed protein product [Lactuca saligna]|uniref:Uncharacterized protein n=1 Tax=Lactuca saligna TaxID=75948 RepID=A0AA36E503_LACSI|nr:unnamed protein product [Lactuca saligna]
MDRWDFDRDTKYRSSKRKDRGGESDEEDRYGDKQTYVVHEWRLFDQDKVAAAEEDRDKDESKEFEDGDKLQQRKLNGETMTMMKNELKDEPCGGALGAPSTPLAPSYPLPPSKVSSLSTKHETEGVDSADAGKIGGISLNALSMAKATLLKNTHCPPQSAARHGGGLPRNSHEAVKRAQELAAKMGFRQDPKFAPLIYKFPGELAPEVAIQLKPAKALVPSLDAFGREVNENAMW